jgi:hypothetical protein
MNQFVESLTRLYQHNKVDEKKLKELLTNKKINQQEYTYIISAKKAV